MRIIFVSFQNRVNFTISALFAVHAFSPAIEKKAEEYTFILILILWLAISLSFNIIFLYFFFNFHGMLCILLNPYRFVMLPNLQPKTKKSEQKPFYYCATLQIATKNTCNKSPYTH